MILRKKNEGNNSDFHTLLVIEYIFYILMHIIVFIIEVFEYKVYNLFKTNYKENVTYVQYIHINIQHYII